MNWPRSLGWAAYAIVTLAVAIIPDLVTLPAPSGAIILDKATFLSGNDAGREVSLPDAIYPRLDDSPDIVRYQIDFDLPAAAGSDVFLLIPSINRRLSLSLNGEPFLGFDSSALFTGPQISSAVKVQLPHIALASGRNRLLVAVESGPLAVPIYLSKIYLGSEAALARTFKTRTFFDSQLKTMALAAHVLVGFGLIFAYFFRPNDPLFSWLASFNVVSIIFVIAMFIGWQPPFDRILPFIVPLTPTIGVLSFGVALALVNIRPPRAMRLVMIASFFALLPCAFIDTTLMKVIPAASGAVVVIGANVVGAVVVAWGALRQGNTDARLMLGPYVLLAWFSVRDAYVTATLPAHAFDLLLPYQRPLFLAFITAVLMRRMGVSLDQLDRSNETLNAKLAEREAELAALHRQERAKTANTVREQERQRLTHDLHDGISGHLVSIIALSERAGDKSTEQAAREALNDLRLVIYSLDLGDTELPLALANFRERLVPQLQRMGVDLDWSMAALPEVSGVTPGNALAILRVLQEAITNALKHGPARRIVVRGAPVADGMVAISVENDGRAFVEGGGGHGLTNMRRRAEQLHGKVSIEATNIGAKLTLLLPSRLPDFEDETVA